MPSVIVVNVTDWFKSLVPVSVTVTLARPGSVPCLMPSLLSSQYTRPLMLAALSSPKLLLMLLPLGANTMLLMTSLPATLPAVLPAVSWPSR